MLFKSRRVYIQSNSESENNAEASRMLRKQIGNSRISVTIPTKWKHYIISSKC